MAKFTLIIACYLFVLVSVCIARPDIDKLKEKVVAVAKHCQDEVGATDVDVQDMANKNPATSMEGKCLRACVMKKYGMMDADGKVLKSSALEFAKKCVNGDADKLEEATAAIETCMQLDFSSNDCEAAEQFKSCFYAKTKHLNIV